MIRLNLILLFALTITFALANALAEATFSNNPSTTFANDSHGSEKGPIYIEKSNIVVETIITIVISILTTVITNAYQEKNRIKQMLQKEFLNAIDELRKRSEDVASQVVINLTSFSQKSHKNSQTAIMLCLKSCAGTMTRAKSLLRDDEAAKFETAFLSWKAELTGAPFPIQKKEFVCQNHDFPVKNVHTAQAALSKYLDDVSRECLCGKLVIPAEHKKG